MKKADFILIGVVAVIVGVMVFFLYGVNNHSGSFVQIEVDSKVVDTLPLDEDKTVNIDSDKNGENTLVIKDGYAVMSQANCPDGICTNHKKINRTGESIICLPHKVVVTVVSDVADDEIDVVA